MILKFTNIAFHKKLHFTLVYLSDSGSEAGTATEEKVGVYTQNYGLSVALLSGNSASGL